MDIESVKAACIERANALGRWEIAAATLVAIIAAQPFGELTTADKTVSGALHDIAVNADALINNPFFRLMLLPLAVWLFERGFRRSTAEKKAAIAADAALRQRDLELPTLIERRRILDNDMRALVEYIERMEKVLSEQQDCLNELKQGPSTKNYAWHYRLPDEEIALAIGGKRFRCFAIPNFQRHEADCQPECVRHPQNIRRVDFDPNHPNNVVWLGVFEAKLRAFQDYIETLRRILSEQEQVAINLESEIDDKVVPWR